MNNMTIFDYDDIQICSKLRKALNDEFTMQYKNGIYGYIQRKMTYSSNHIEGSTLNRLNL